MKISRTLFCCLLLAAASQCNVISNSREDNSEVTTTATDNISDATPATVTDDNTDVPANTPTDNTVDGQSSPAKAATSSNTVDGDIDDVDSLEFWEEEGDNKGWFVDDLEQHGDVHHLDGGPYNPGGNGVVLSSPVNGESEDDTTLGFMTREEKISSWLLDDLAEHADINLIDGGGANYSIYDGPSYSGASSSKGVVAEILKLREKGEKYVNLKGHKDVVLLLGMSGSGKSTLAQFLSSDTLEAVKDKGEFMIRDTENKISITTSKSHTTFPELVVDRNTSTAYVDCPGFRDTRGVSFDVAATYLTKYAVDMSRRVKLVFSVGHNSVRPSIDRDGFRTLLKHGAKFVKNVDQFKDGIALVVTKVDATFELIGDGDMPVMVSDVQVKRSIASFLGELRESIRNSTPFTALDASCVKLIDIFLEKRGDEYYKFDLFRRPRKAGLLIKNDILLAERTRIRKLIHEDLKFVPKTASDFGYSLSADSGNSISKLVDEMNTQIFTEVRLIAEHIKNHFTPIEEQSKDTVRLHEQFQDWSNVITPLIKEAIGSSNLTVITSRLADVATRYHLALCRVHLERIAKHNKFLDFLLAVSEKELSINPLEWTQPLPNVLEYIDNSKNWYGFLNLLYSKLAQHEAQSDTSRYNVTDLNDWGKTGKKQGLKVTSNNLNVFVKSMKTFIGAGAENLHNLKVNPVKLSALNRILDITVKQRPQIVTANEKLTARGRFIKLSEVNKELTSILNKKVVIKSVEIFALDTVFIDTDVSLIGKEIAMSINAPKWHVVGIRKIVLDGIAGSAQEKAKDGSLTGSKGYDGKSGSPGGNAGRFFGLGERIVNGQFLTVTANGGKGGAGQEGGIGGNGNDGKDPVWGSAKDIQKTDYMTDLFKDTLFTMKHKNTDNSRYNSAGLAMGRRAYAEFYDVSGTNGTVGGGGGNGGKGGQGGEAGSANVIGLQGKSGVILSSKPGESGEGGIGGKGGDGGKHGCILELLGVTFVEVAYGIKFKYRYVMHELSRDCPGNASSGANGTVGELSKIIPVNEALALQFSTRDIINYKTYLRENLANAHNSRAIIETLTLIDKSTDVIKLSSPLGLIEELNSLEQHFYQLKLKIDFLPYYQSLLNRITLLNNKLKSDAKFLDDRKVLSYLYAATLSKICSLNNRVEGYHIVDLAVHLNSALDNINIWESKTLKEVDSLYEDYEKNIDNKVTNAKDMIDNQISTEIDLVNEMIEEQISKLIDETQGQVDQLEANKDKLKKKKEEMRKSMITRAIFSSLKLIGSVASFLGPVGTAVGGAIGVGSSIAESFVVDKDVPVGQTKEVTDGVKKLLKLAEDNVKRKNEDKLLILEKNLEKLEVEILDLPKELGGIDVKKMREEIRDARNNPFTTPETIKELENKLKGQLKKEQDKMKLDNKLEGRDRKDRANKAIARFNTISQVASVAADVAIKHINDQKKMDEIDKALKEEQEKINKLLKYEESIYTVMTPLISSVRDGVNKLGQELSGHSQVALDVAKWQIQSRLRDMKLQLEQFTRGFEMQENLTRCIEKLDEAMTTLIQVYDRIKEYQDQKSLSVLIKNLSFDKAKKIHPTNEELNVGLQNIEVVIKSNIILSQYERAMNSFKQFVFPYAKFYLSDYELPLDIRVDNSTKSLVDQAANRIKSMKAKLQSKYAEIIKEHDTHIYDGDFVCNSMQSCFNIWRNNVHGDAISQLLSGKEIVLKADVRSNTKLNAVKFDEIGLVFRTLTSGLQKDLERVLIDENFGINMTHMGNSYYRCDDQYYVIESDSQSIFYSFKMSEKNPGEPATKNEVYKKMKRGDLTLSPYAMWKIQLVHMGKDFDKLERFHDLVDLELVGHGVYIYGSDVCRTGNLDRYYQTYNDFSDTD